MKKGDRVRLTAASGSVREGWLLLCSENEDSLMVGLEDGLRTSGGLYVDMVPLLRTDGAYRELMGGEAVELAVIAPK